MEFKNKPHRAVFNDAAKKLDRHNKTSMAVLYLLTADAKLWRASERHIQRGKIHIEKIKLRKSTPIAYTLLCCAKDIALGTNYISVPDLADTAIVSPMMLGIIWNAISIRRYGIQTMRNSDWNKIENITKKEGIKNV